MFAASFERPNAPALRTRRQRYRLLLQEHGESRVPIHAAGFNGDGTRQMQTPGGHDPLIKGEQTFMQKYLLLRDVPYKQFRARASSLLFWQVMDGSTVLPQALDG